MARFIDPDQVGQAKLFTDQYGGCSSSVNYGQALLLHQAADGLWRYVAWYRPDNQVMLARRRDDQAEWDAIELTGMTLQANDSHNTLNLGISAIDGRLHVAAGQHNDPLQYTCSNPNLVDLGQGAIWSDAAFNAPSATLLGTVIGDLTYPTFTRKPGGGLLFWWREGGSGNGRMRLAEYEDGAWTIIGDVTSSTGTWSSNGGSSSARNFYWAHPVYGADDMLHLTGVWRESNASVLCSPGMITNHHIAYLTSPDHGRAWFNLAGTQVATTGSDPIAVGDPGIHIPSFANTNLAHQISDLALGPNALVGILPDYVDPSLLSGSPKCVQTMDQRFTLAGHGPRWLSGGAWDAEMVRVGGVIVKTGYPSGRKASSRGRMAFAPNGDMVVIFSGMRILSARAATGYTDWTVDEDGANTAYAYGEIGGVDRSREDEGILSVLYMRRDGVIMVRDISLES